MDKEYIKYKALHLFLNIKSFYSLSEKDICKEIVMRNGLFLKYIEEENKTFDVCLEALLNNKDAIKYLPKNLSVHKLNIFNTLYTKPKQSTKVSPIKTI